MSSIPKYEPPSEQERLSAEYRWWADWSSRCHCPKPLSGRKYLGHYHCLLCGGDMGKNRSVQRQTFVAGHIRPSRPHLARYCAWGDDGGHWMSPQDERKHLMGAATTHGICALHQRMMELGHSENGNGKLPPAA